MLLILLILLILLFGGGGIALGEGPCRTGGISLSAIVLIILIVYLLGGFDGFGHGFWIH